MKKLIFVVVVVTFIGYFGCNTGGKNMRSIISNGMELTIEIGEHWQEKMKIFIFSVKKTPQLSHTAGNVIESKVYTNLNFKRKK
jgi:hypothetical protein